MEPPKRASHNFTISYYNFLILKHSKTFSTPDRNTQVPFTSRGTFSFSVRTNEDYSYLHTQILI